MIYMQQLCPSRRKTEPQDSYRGHSLERLAPHRWKCSYCGGAVTEAALARRKCVSSHLEEEILTEKLLAFLPHKRKGQVVTPTIDVEELAAVCETSMADVVGLMVRHGPLDGSFRLAGIRVGFQLPDGLRGRVLWHHLHGEHRYG